MRKMNVYIVQHVHTLGDAEDVKLIGVYKTKVKAQNAVNRAKKLKGFKSFSDGFTIDEYEVDKDHWNEGSIKA